MCVFSVVATMLLTRWSTRCAITHTTILAIILTFWTWFSSQSPKTLLKANKRASRRTLELINDEESALDCVLFNLKLIFILIRPYSYTAYHNQIYTDLHMNYSRRSFYVVWDQSIQPRLFRCSFLKIETFIHRTHWIAWLIFD